MKARLKPVVSVIIPVTRQNPYLLATLESVRKQSVRDIEILVGNATGTRAIGGMLRKYAKRRKNVRIFKISSDRDKRSTFNSVVRKAKGRFVARINPGDIAVKTRLAKQIAFLDAHPLAIAVGGQIRPYQKYARVTTKPLPLNHEDIYALSFLSLAINPSTMMVNRNRLPTSFRWYNQSLEHVQEYDLMFHLMEHGQVANLPDTVCFTHNIHLFQQAVSRGATIAQSVRAIMHAITRYGMSPNIKSLTRSSLRFLL